MRVMNFPRHGFEYGNHLAFLAALRQRITPFSGDLAKSDCLFAGLGKRNKR
jgi:hypothetical protein